MRRMEKLLALVLMVVMLLCISGIASAQTFKVGTYRAEAFAHNAEIVVDVTFSENELTDIVIVEENESKEIGNVAMAKMSKEIIERQSLAVDVVSGATVTSAIFSQRRN